MGVLAPAMLKLRRGGEILRSFRPDNNTPSLSAGYTQFLHSRNAEELSSPEEPKMHQNFLQPRLRSGPHWGSLQRFPGPLAGG